MNPGPIGTNVSSGCIRLTNEDIVDLYNRTPIGAPICRQGFSRKCLCDLSQSPTGKTLRLGFRSPLPADPVESVYTSALMAMWEITITCRDGSRLRLSERRDHAPLKGDIFDTGAVPV
jgi:hypothetical protein